MTITMTLHARQVAVLVAVAATVLVTVWWVSPALSQTAESDPLPSFAVVARADDPVDALAAAAVAGQLGAPVYLTFSDTLDEHARRGLVTTDPDVVVLAGGPVALSARVEQEVATLLPGAQVRRAGGAGRTETARLLNELPGELGVVRPVVAGATVAGDVGIDGTLTVAGTNVLDRLKRLEARTGTLESQLVAANGRIGALESQVGALQAMLDGVTRTDVGGRDTLRFEAMNLQLVNGTGTTDGTPTGEGNLIIGYNGPRSGTTVADRAGSHYLVVGDQHHWSSFAGAVVGIRNTASGLAASVIGGFDNIASGPTASVTGGVGNVASGSSASVAGGSSNTASGVVASVAGGNTNTVSGAAAAVAGGRNGTVSGSYDSMIGNQGFPDS